jgi:hypothetical protein
MTKLLGQKSKPKGKAPSKRINNSVWSLAIRWSKTAKCWIFDDARFGLVDEPFVGTTNGIIDWAIEKKHGFGSAKSSKTGRAPRNVVINFTFDKAPPKAFKDHVVVCELVSCDGDWSEYKSWDGPKETGWLCPALFHYASGESPKTIYVWVS